MTIRKPPGKRLTSLLLSLALLLTLVPAMGTTAAAANAEGISIGINTVDSKGTGWTYTKATQTLTLNNYDGGKIIFPTVKDDITIQLIGENKITVNGETAGILASALNLTSKITICTAPNQEGSLTIDVRGSGEIYGVCTARGQLDNTFRQPVIICGSAKVTITVASTNGKAWGINATGNVEILDNASLDVTCSTGMQSDIDGVDKVGAGIFAGQGGGCPIILNTTGDVKVDYSNAEYVKSTDALAASKVTLTKGTLDMKWKSSGNDASCSYGNAFDGYNISLYAHRQNNSKGIEIFKCGTPRTLKLVNALDEDWSVNNDNEVQYVAGEKVTLKPLSITDVSHTGWKSADVSISGDTFIMPEKDIVTVEGVYNVFAQQPSFKRTYDSPTNDSGTISFKLNGSPMTTRTALVRETGDGSDLFLSASATISNGEWKYIAYNNETANGVLPGRYRVRVEYGNYTFYSDVFTVKYAAPAASVAEDVIVDGLAGTAINETFVTVTLQKDTFVSTLSGNWITNLPAGLSQSVTRTNDTTATITITGTPLVASTEEMVIVIPAGALVEESGTPVGVDTNSNAKFNITSSYPAAENIQIGDGSNSGKFSNEKPYYKNGTNGAFGEFTNSDSDYNAKYDPQTGTLTLKDYDGPYIKITGSSNQMVTIDLKGSDNKAGGKWSPAIRLVGGVNLIITAGTEANLTLTAGGTYYGIGNADSDLPGFVTISGKANVTINASTGDSSFAAYGIRSGKDVTIEKNASLSVNCTKTVDSNVTAYGIKAIGKVTVDTTGTVDINVSGCGQVNGTYCIQANSIAFNNAETITLKYVPAFDWYMPTYSTTFDASGMKSPTTVPIDEYGKKLVGEVTTVTYAKKGAQPAKPEIRTVVTDLTKLTEPTQVTLFCETPGVVIYYTTDGSDPRDSSSTREEYDADNPFEVKKTCTVKAVAYSAEDRLYSEVASKPFKWKRYSISLAGGGASYSDSERTTTLSYAEPGTTVYLLAPLTKTLAGKELIFSYWEVLPSSVSVQNKSSYNQAYFIMPGEGASVTAIYIDKPAGVTVSGTAVSWNNSDDALYYLYPTTMSDADIRAQWKTGGTVSGYSYTGTKEAITATTVDGKAMQSQSFSFSTVPAGTYKLVIFKPDKYVPKIVTITVESTSDLDLGQLKLWLKGDVNGDGTVNGNDIQRLYSHITGASPLTDADALIVADANEDTTINGNDIQRIFTHIVGSNIFED